MHESPPLSKTMSVAVTAPGDHVIPLFYLHTAPDVIAFPSPVDALGAGANVEPNACHVTLLSLPSLEESTRRAVITLMMSGVNLQTRVVSNGEIFSYSTALYSEYIPGASGRGVIYVRVRQDPIYLSADERRFAVLANINRPDYEVISYPDENPPADALAADSRRTVRIADGAILKIPVREIVRQFSTVFASTDVVNAPGVAIFTKFSPLAAAPASTVFIALPDYAHSLLTISAHQSSSLLSNLPGLVDPATYQPAIKMTQMSWTVIALLWVAIFVTFSISIGVTYRWYIKQYM